jgi:hypothetical protein
MTSRMTSSISDLTTMINLKTVGRAKGVPKRHCHEITSTTVLPETLATGGKLCSRFAYFPNFCICV